MYVRSTQEEEALEQSAKLAVLRIQRWHLDTHQHFVAAAQQLLRNRSRYCPMRQEWVWRKRDSQRLFVLVRHRCDQSKICRSSRKQCQKQQQLNRVSPQHVQ